MTHDEVYANLYYSTCEALGTEMTEKCPRQCMKREMSQCCGIKQYTQTENLQQIGHI
jgi:hypothetical protein